MGVAEAIAILENGAEVARSNASLLRADDVPQFCFDERPSDSVRLNHCLDTARSYERAVAYLLVHQNKETENVQDHA
jgi:hypothetical protein